MTKKRKGRAPAKNATHNTLDSSKYNKTDPLIAWFNLSKQSRIERRPKREWRRHGRAQP